MITLVISAVMVLVTYLLAAVIQFGIPESISNTFYLYESKRKNLGYIFTIFMYTEAILMLPAMISLSAGFWWQFLGFLSPAGIAFCGCAAWSKDKEVKPIHFAGAYAGAICGLAWCFLIDWIFTIVTLGGLTITCLVLSDTTLTLQRCKVWWIELMSFGTIALVLLKVATA